MADDSKGQQSIIIVKKIKKSHGGHHGGAWKVAYADFVTALMAFFLVMWLVSQSDTVKESIQMYFQDPASFMKGKGGGMLKGGGKTAITTVGEAELAIRLKKERQALLNVAKNIREAIEKIPELAGLKDQIDIEITPEGLRIQLIDSDEKNDANFFDIGSARLKPGAALLLAAIAHEVGRMPNYIVVEGHTDSRGYSGSNFGYSNWELSVDRANSARKLLESAGLSYGQIVEIRGNADRRPRIPGNSADPRNRRVVIILLNHDAAKRYLPG